MWALLRVGGLMRRVLYTILAVALAAPVVFITIMLGSEYTLFVIVLDLVVAAIAGTLAYFWWRCPACRRPFAGRLVGREPGGRQHAREQERARDGGQSADPDRANRQRHREHLRSRGQ